MPSFGFNDITDEAKHALDQEGIPYLYRGVWESWYDLPEVPLDYRIFKEGKRGWYYYLFKEKVYCAINDITLDYRTTPPTQGTRMVLDVVAEDLQGAWRDRLYGLRSDHLGGILK